MPGISNLVQLLSQPHLLDQEVHNLEQQKFLLQIYNLKANSECQLVNWQYMYQQSTWCHFNKDQTLKCEHGLNGLKPVSSRRRVFQLLLQVSCKVYIYFHLAVCYVSTNQRCDHYT